MVAELEELQDGLFKKLATLFLQDTPADVGRLRGALAAGDTSAAKKAAHKIQGSSAVVGAATVASAAAHVETVARDDDLCAAKRGFERLEETLEEAERALSERLGQTNLAPGDDRALS